MTWGKSLLLTIPLALSGILVVASPAEALDSYRDYATDWTSVSVGGSHECGIHTGKLYCWGNDDSGQRGDDNGFDNVDATPNRVGNDTGWTAVSAGAAHTCGIRNTKLYCWGSNSHGQLGNGGGSDQDSPVKIGDAAWRSVSAGAAHTCAIRSDYKLACWGSDETEQLGNGSLGGRTVPVLAPGAATWLAVSAGDGHTCAIRSDRKLACWGDDSSGQVGNGNLGSPSLPALVSNTATWTSVSAGGVHTCAVRSDHLLACWGGNARGQLGIGNFTQKPAPVQVPPWTDWKTVSAGKTHTCATRGTGALYCWGDNTYGQVTDDASTTAQPVPVRRYGSVADYRTTDAGDRLSCGIRSGLLYCWGGITPGTTCTAASVSPGTLDLNYWKLTIPFDGTDSNSYADTIAQQALANYSDPRWFWHDMSNSYFFRADTDGATTKNSNYPRSELREMGHYPDSYSEAGWSNLDSKTHVMSLKQAITHVPDVKPHIVAGQIHDASNDVLEIRLEGPVLKAAFSDGTKQTLDSTYTLGAQFDLQIQADECGITVTYNSVKQAAVPIFAGAADWYFKAGAYTQASSLVPADDSRYGTGYGEVRIDGLSIQHS